MKITDNNWQLRLSDAVHAAEMLAYAQERGLELTTSAARRYVQGDYLGCTSDQLGYFGRQSEDQDISEKQFKRMCDEYAQEHRIGSTAAATDHGQFYCMVEGTDTPPTVIHPTINAAKTEARRLVEKTGKKVRILRAMLEVAPAGRYIETEL